MVEYLDEKIGVKDNDESPELFPDIYQERELAQLNQVNYPLEMKHEDSLYKDNHVSASRNETVTAAMGELSPGQISVEYLQGGNIYSKDNQWYLNYNPDLAVEYD